MWVESSCHVTQCSNGFIWGSTSGPSLGGKFPLISGDNYCAKKLMMLKNSFSPVNLGQVWTYRAGNDLKSPVRCVPGELYIIQRHGHHTIYIKSWVDSMWNLMVVTSVQRFCPTTFNVLYSKHRHAHSVTSSTWSVSLIVVDDSEVLAHTFGPTFTISASCITEKWSFKYNKNIASYAHWPRP